MYEPPRTSSKTLLVTTLGVLLFGSYATAQGQELPVPAGRARLIRCTPATVAPGMWIKLEGYQVDGSAPNVRILFVQDGQSFAGSPTGGSRESFADSQGYLESVGLTVPPVLHPGKCDIVIETDGIPSAPLEVEITDSVSPAVISHQRPVVGQPGDLIMLTAIGICDSDKIELLDSADQTYIIDPRPTSEGTGAAFQIPDDLSGGLAIFWVVEKRSGLDQHSNVLPLRIEVDPAPLVVYLPELGGNSLAPGQWIDAAIQNNVLAERAELIEVAFTQNEQVIVPVQPLKNSRESRLHVQVPTWLRPAPVKISTRTWIKGRASSWSDPLEVELLDHPAAPHLWGIYRSKPEGDPQSIDFTSPGPSIIRAHPGDSLVLSGMFMVESATRLRITLEGPQENIELLLLDTGDQARLRFTLPDKLDPGEWHIVVSNVSKAVSVRAPVTVVIESR